MPKKRPPHLRSLPPALADSLTPEQSRELADLRLERARERMERDARGWANGPEGLDAIPLFLHEIETALPRAADLWYSVAPGSPVTEVERIGARFGLSPADVAERLGALARAELATLAEGGDGVRRVSMQGPASIPF